MIKLPLESAFFNKNNELNNFLSLGLVVDGVYLAGGSLRVLVSESEINDFDLFFRNPSDELIVSNKLIKLGFKKIFQCPKNELKTFYKKGYKKVQLITKRFYDSPKELIYSFDFTAAMWSTDGQVVFTTYNCIDHTNRKVLHINAIEYPAATMRRFIKYSVNNEFYATQESIESFLFIVHGMSLNKDNMVFYID